MPPVPGGGPTSITDNLEKILASLTGLPEDVARKVLEALGGARQGGQGHGQGPGRGGRQPQAERSQANPSGNPADMTGGEFPEPLGRAPATSGQGQQAQQQDKTAANPSGGFSLPVDRPGEAFGTELLSRLAGGMGGPGGKLIRFFLNEYRDRVARSNEPPRWATAVNPEDAMPQSPPPPTAPDIPGTMEPFPETFPAAVLKRLESEPPTSAFGKPPVPPGPADREHWTPPPVDARPRPGDLPWEHQEALRQRAEEREAATRPPTEFGEPAYVTPRSWVPPPVTSEPPPAPTVVSAPEAPPRPPSAPQAGSVREEVLGRYPDLAPVPKTYYPDEPAPPETVAGRAKRAAEWKASREKWRAAAGEPPPVAPGSWQGYTQGGPVEEAPDVPPFLARFAPEDRDAAHFAYEDLKARGHDTQNIADLDLNYLDDLKEILGYKLKGGYEPDRAANVLNNVLDYYDVPVPPDALPVDEDEGHARGGQVEGPAGVDRVPAMLTKDEYVIPAGPAQKHRGLLERIREDDVPEGPATPMAKGGAAGEPPTPAGVVEAPGQEQDPEWWLRLLDKRPELFAQLAKQNRGVVLSPEEYEKLLEQVGSPGKVESFTPPPPAPAPHEKASEHELAYRGFSTAERRGLATPPAPEAEQTGPYAGPIFSPPQPPPGAVGDPHPHEDQGEVDGMGGGGLGGLREVLVEIRDGVKEITDWVKGDRHGGGHPNHDQMGQGEKKFDWGNLADDRMEWENVPESLPGAQAPWGAGGVGY